MGRVIGRGIKTSQENIELIKQELEVAQKAGVELINKNTELENKLKATELELEEKRVEIAKLTEKNTELENKLKATEVKSVGRSTSKAE